jgi:hypothetical protein
MSGDKLQLERLLKQLNEKFDRELRARGFDPSQAETIALPGALVTIFIERQLLLEKLSDLHGTTSKENYMMTEVERILDQFRRAFDGEAWTIGALVAERCQRGPGFCTSDSICTLDLGARAAHHRLGARLQAPSGGRQGATERRGKLSACQRLERAGLGGRSTKAGPDTPRTPGGNRYN